MPTSSSTATRTSPTAIGQRASTLGRPVVASGFDTLLLLNLMWITRARQRTNEQHWSPRTISIRSQPTEPSAG
jgi:hypothetical protein